MCDPDVYLFVQKNREGISSDPKIRDAFRQYTTVFKAMADALPSTTDETLLIYRTPRGKPFLPQFPGLHLSVSHSGEWFICAISNQPVGIDLQEHALLHGETYEQALIRYCKIARRFFHPLEAAFVEIDPKDRFFPVWTAKESYVKYTGQGMDQYYDSFCVLDLSPGAVSPLPTGISWQAEQAFFLQLPFSDVYTFCICTAGPCNCRWIYPENTAISQHIFLPTKTPQNNK